MSVVVKGALTAAVLTVGCTGTYFLMTGKGNGPITLKDETNTDASYNGKIGGDFKYFLVSPFNKKNRSFWEQAFRKWQTESSKASPSLSTEFTKDTKVTKAFAESSTGNTNNDDKALNRVCHSLYTNKGKSDLSISESDTEKKKLTTDLFTYCSALGGLPKTVKESSTAPNNSYGENNLGKTKEDKLIATTGNDTWWDLKTKEFLGDEDTKNDQFFKKLHTDKQTLRALCQEAYGKAENTSTSTQDKPQSDKVLKYCSLLGS